MLFFVICKTFSKSCHFSECWNIRAILLKFYFFFLDFDPQISAKCIYSVYHFKVKYLTQNYIRRKFVNKTSMQSLLKMMDISSATAWVALTTVRRSAVTMKTYIQPYWKSEKKPQFCRWSLSLSLTSFSKTLLTTEGRLTGG